MTNNSTGENPNGAALFEAANKLRGSVESAEYKHLVLGLIFLKYISDTFTLRREQLQAELADPDSELYTEDVAERKEVLEDRDEYVAENVFWVPEDARWEKLLAAAQQPDIARRIDDALEAIENKNPRLRNVLPRIYTRAPLSAELMGSLLQTIAKIGFGKGAKEARDILGRTYEYFIKEFARSEGHRGGEFFTPGPVARLLVEMLQPFQGRVLDPACGSCGLFVQSGRFIEAHGGNPDMISIYGQERNQATWRIGLMNLAIHGLAGEVRYTEAGSLLDDAFPSLKADYVMANPPFNQREWSTPAIVDDVRWAHGMPPAGNANYAWIQHFVSHLAPDGRAGFVMANGSLTSAVGGESAIRTSLLRSDLVDCVVALPAQLFYTTGIPVCLWFIDRDKTSAGERDRRGEMLFVDARQMGSKISRTQIELTTDELDRVVSVYHAWRGQPGAAPYVDEAGFCRAVSLDDVEAAGFALTPGRYVGAPEAEEEAIAFEERMATLVDQLADDLAVNDRLATAVREALAKVGHDV
ncbi:type I restriction-modification system subunit M [Conexibacter woesei]|uniref:type I restriction-modification system subunit M n=1 Tax=Conexibacter woesei TaxID=191495 RepID=UPI00040E02F2|nr:class I SAM-dependent DNA methyltransferase [Conexibacter woesei]